MLFLFVTAVANYLPNAGLLRHCHWTDFFKKHKYNIYDTFNVLSNSQEHCTNHGNNYPDDDIVTQFNFYFSFKGDYRFKKPNLFIFISTREFSFPHFAFNLLKIFTKLFIEVEHRYHIYSSECPGHSFNFELSKGDTYLREALFWGRRSLNVSNRHQNTFNLSRKSNNKIRTVIITRIECLMFKKVCIKHHYLLKKNSTTS